MLINNVIYVIFCLCLCVHQSNLNVLAEILLLTYQNVNALANLSYYILSFLNKIAWAKHLGCWLAIFLHSLLINDAFQYKWETFWFISSDKVWKIRKSFQESQMKGRVIINKDWICEFCSNSLQERFQPNSWHFCRRIVCKRKCNDSVRNRSCKEFERNLKIQSKNKTFFKSVN